METLVLATTLIVLLIATFNLRVGIYAAILFTVGGEITRLPFGPGIGLLPNDLLLTGLMGIWITKQILQRRLCRTRLLAPIATFIGIALLSLLMSLRAFEANQVVESALFLARFIVYIHIYFIVFDEFKQKRHQKNLINIIILSGVLLVFAGLIQYKILPDFTAFEEFGWDPHIGRLLSTWFDPNFIGGLFGILGIGTLGWFIKNKEVKGYIQPVKIGLFLLFCLGLFLTFSRSAYLAFAAGAFVMLLIKDRKILIAGMIAVIILASFPGRAQDRILNTVDSAKSLLTETYTLPDPTARFRLDSWSRGLTLYKQNPVIGVGFNTYKHATFEQGLTIDQRRHDVNGSDSTIITIMATTGTLGLLAYIWFFIGIFKIAFKQKSKILLGTTILLLVHSIFVNSLLFTPILIYFYILIALSELETSNTQTA